MHGQSSATPTEDSAPAGDRSVLPDSSVEIFEELARSKSGSFAESRTQRATLNLMEDALLARQQAERENAERRRSEGALRVSEERLQLALDAAAMGTFVWDVQEDRGEPDAQMQALFGLPPDGSLTLRTALATMIHPDDRERYAANVARATDPEGGGVLREDIRVVLPNGSLRWLAITGQVKFEGEPRRAVRMAGAAIDITTRKQIEEALRESEARQVFLLRLSDALRRLTDPKEIQAIASRMLGEHLSVSRALYAAVETREDSDYYIISQDYHVPDVPSLVGTHRADDFGATLFEEMRAGRTLTVADVTTEPRITERERVAYSALGIQAYISVPLIKQEHHVAILGVLQTAPRAWTPVEIALVEETAERTWASVERAQTEAALREAKAAADLANKGKDRFLAVLSHELRTPLTPVLLLVGAMQQDKKLPEDVQENLAMIRRNIEIETRLIDDLLDLTRLGSSKVHLNLRPVDLNDIVKQACAICEPLSKERDIHVECRFDDAVGKISADPLRLQQAFWNVLKNAIKFTMTRGRIEISTARLSDNRCEVRIRDNGIGIPPDKLSRIFDVFEQGDPAITRLYGGMGLGLAISKALVDLHEGTIRAESAGVGEGSCFVMEFAMAADAAQE